MADKNLTPILENASNEDLDLLVGYILKATISESLSNNEIYKEFSPDHSQYVDLIENEIRKFGGNSFVNFFRGEGPDYLEIVYDVANKLNASFHKDASIEEIEMAILMTFMSQAWEKMSDEEKLEFAKQTGMGWGIDRIPKALPLIALQTAIKASGFVAYKIAMIVANAVANAVLGRGLALAANAALARWLAVFAGPIGWIITCLWTALDIAGPAYRVTIPCVVHIAMLRQKQLISVNTCYNCGSVYPLGSKFCPECGNAIV